MQILGWFFIFLPFIIIIGMMIYEIGIFASIGVLMAVGSIICSFALGAFILTKNVLDNTH